MKENPVLNPSELKAHLNLLRAFHDMKSKVKDGSKLGLDVHTTGPEAEWKSFVQASVERYIVCECALRGMMTICCFRFQGWVSSLKINDNDVAEKIECPPLDVCLVWHAYMLNPRWGSFTSCAREIWLIPVTVATPEIPSNSRL